MTDISLSSKKKALDEGLSNLGSVLVAFSGGVDSSFLLYEAIQVLGKENVLAVTGLSETIPQHDQETVSRLVQKLEAAHVTIITKELSDPRFARNPENRCYYCKDELYGKLKPIAKEQGYVHILDGTNADDEKDYRPGQRAAREHEIISPLRDAGLTKDEIRSLSKKYNLETWDKPSSPCLSSRFPYGTLITVDKLSQVEQAEGYLRSLGIRECRVRHMGNTAKIELSIDEMPKILDDGVRNLLIDRFRSIGFLFVTLDLEGFKSGHLNKSLRFASDAGSSLPLRSLLHGRD